MISLLAQLIPLFKKKENCYLLLIAGLVIALFLSAIKIKRLEVALAQPPKIEEKIVTKTIIGPTRTVERIIEKPGGEKIVERTIYREKEEIGTELERKQEPGQVSIRANRYLIGAGLYILEAGRPISVHAGYSFNNRLDLLYGFKPVGAEHQLTAVMRF